jgi:hypothetical protein
MKTQRIALVISILLAFGMAMPVQADEQGAVSANGFYGASLRDRATEGPNHFGARGDCLESIRGADR